MHIYTNNTRGGNDKVSFLCETAVEKGFRAVAFTDKCDIDSFNKYYSGRRLRHSYFDMAKSKGVFIDSLVVFSGIEFVQAVTNPEKVDEILKTQEYDIVLTSVERSYDGKDFQIDYEMPQEKFNDFAAEYTGLLKDTVIKTDFDVLSKPLFPLRNADMNFDFFKECMKPVLKLLAEREKALEIDAKDLSGSEKLRDLYIELLKMFRDCGGRYVTFGSETYFNEEIGKGLDFARTAAKIANFEHITLFDKRFAYQFPF